VKYHKALLLQKTIQVKLNRNLMKIEWYLLLIVVICGMPHPQPNMFFIKADT